MDEEKERIDSRITEFDRCVRIPLWQSIVTGFFISLVLTMFTWRGFASFQATMKTVVLGGVMGMILMWSLLLWWVNRRPRGERIVNYPSERIVERPFPVYANPPAAREGDEREQRLADLRRFLLDVEQLGSTALSVLQVRGWNKDSVAEARSLLIRSGFGAWNAVREDGTPTVQQGWHLLYNRKVILKRMGLDERD